MRKSKKLEYYFAATFRERIVAPTIETSKLYGSHYLATIYPKTTQELQLVVQYANKNKVLILQAGGMVKIFPAKDFILLDFAHMNKISWNKQDAYVNVEVGVNAGELFSSAKNTGNWIPCLTSPLESLNLLQVVTDLSITGASSYVHGPVSSFIIGFEGVLGSGEVVSAPPSGYCESLEQVKNLFLDRFSRYGILTHLSIKTLPAPRSRGMFLVEVRSLKVAFHLIETFRKVSPSILECYFLDKRALEVLSEFKGLSLAKDGTAYVILFEIFSTSLEELSKLMNRVQISLADVLEDVIFVEQTQLEEEIEKKYLLRKQLDLAVIGGSFDVRKECFTILPCKIPLFIEDCGNIKKDFGIDFLFSGSLEHGFINVHILNTNDEGGFIWRTFQHEIRAKLLDILSVHGGRPITYSKEEQDSIETFFLDKTAVSIMRHLQTLCDPNHILFPTHDEGVLP